MHRPRSARLAAGAALTVTSLLAASSPALAATPAERPGSGEAAGSAVSLTVHLPGGAATTIELLIDPVTGAVSRRVNGKDARAVAALLGSSAGPLQTLFGNAGPLTGRVEARLPAPTTATSDPAAQIGQGLSGTPLANLLDLHVLGSGARVNAAPASASTAQVSGVAVGLPAAVASALQPLTDPLTKGLNELLTQLAELLSLPVDKICEASTSPLATQDRQRAVDQLLSDLRAVAGGKAASDPALAAALPTMGGLLGGRALAQAAPGTPSPPTATPALAAALSRELAALTVADLPVLCSAGTTLDQLNSALTTGLKSLTGRGGVLSTGLITASQQITSQPSKVSSTATTSVADLTLLGSKPFASTKVLTTTSTATATGSASSTTATVTSTVATLKGGTVDPFADLRATVHGLTGQLAGLPLDPQLATVLDSLTATLNSALAPVGVTVVALDNSEQARRATACPTALTSALTGTYRAVDGSCAAAATRGVGIEVTLPSALATPLGISGALVSLQIVPTAALARLGAAPVAAPPARTFGGVELAHTGAAPLTAVAGLLLLGVAVVLRRRRTI